MGTPFTLVYLEELSVFEQAQMFNAAQVIVGPHGSGFANLIFARPGTPVIEIDHYHVDAIKQRSCFKKFAALTNCKYIPFYADHVREKELEEDMSIELSAFEKIVTQVLSKAAC